MKGTKAWVLSERKELRINNNVLWQQRFLHSPPSHDDTYAIARNRFLSQLDPGRQQGVAGPNKKHSSLVTMKRPISGTRGQDLSRTFCFSGKESGVVVGDGNNRSLNNYINISLEPAVEGLTIVLQLFPPVQAQPPLLMHEWNIFRSIHSTFPLMEDDSSRSHRFLDTELPYSSHPETPIRIPRRRIRDAPSPHPPRVIPHRHRNPSAPKNPLSPVGTSGLPIFPWNRYTYESESLPISLWERALHYKPFSRGGAPLDQTQSTRKVGHIAAKPRVVEPPSWIIFAPGEAFPPGEPSIHYARCGNNSIIALEGATLAEKRKHYYPRFRRYHSYSAHSAGGASPRGSMNKSFEDRFPSPGHTSGTRPEIITVRARMVSDSLITGIPAEELRAMTPITHSIGLFARERFCNTVGRPISRSARTTLGDGDISNRFYQISASIHYYSGCSNRNGLYQMQYIPRSPRAKTLASKHKGTIRVVREKYGSRLFHKPPGERASFSTKIRYHKKTNRYSDITRVDSFANHLRRELFVPALNRFD
uniref:Maturase K n=1 Tax=Selaginella sanguinolenta TaxID=493175 RepID=A0A650FHK7_9TRAC|nr:maturase K [Selaginella sanguinolenta]